MMLDKIEMILREACDLQPEKPAVLGVSGGADSVCLLHVLNHLGYNLLVVHVNHKLRLEADEEAHVVNQFAHSLGVKFTLRQVDVHSYADENAVSIEEAARMLRYQALFTEAEKSQAQAVLVAHNADDQVETILMHILRGSGLTGLRGMDYRTLPHPWSTSIPLVRPLISTWREEILDYLDQHAVSYSTDISNFDTTYFRNRLRHELLPYLEQYNPRIRENLLRMGQVNKEDYAVIQRLVADTWQNILAHCGVGYVALRLPGYQKSSASIQRYLLRKAIAVHLPSLRDIEFESIQRGVKFLNDDTKRGQIDLVAGLRLIKEGEIFWVASWCADLPMSDFPMIPVGEQLILEVPSTLELKDGWQFKVVVEEDIEEAVQHSRMNNDPFQTWLDLDEVAPPLLVRNRKPGERFQPLGMNGHSLKVSDLMINVKFPRRARLTWPLVCMGDSILWIPGCRQGHLAKLQPGSSRIAHITLSKSSAT